MAFKSEDIRISNTMKILELFRQNKILIRKDIIDITGLTAPSVSKILYNLQEKLVIDSTEKKIATGGRKAKGFKLKTENHLVLAIHVGVENLYAAVVNLSGEIVKFYDYSDYFNKNVNHDFVKKVHEIIIKVLNLPDMDSIKDMIKGIGISFPGVLDNEKNIHLAFNIHGENLSFSYELWEEIELPIYIENDARLGALAELWWARQSLSDIVFLMADYGVGAGMITNGEIHHGVNNGAGNIGHAVLDPNGKRCTCGQFGCLETFVSFPALVERIKKQIRMGRPTVLLTDGADEPSISSMNQIINAALKGDSLSIEIFEEVGRYLAIAVSMINVLVDPGIVYIGGNMGRVFEIMIKPINEILRQRSPEIHRNLQVKPASFREKTCLMGAAALVYKELFEKEEI